MSRKAGWAREAHTTCVTLGDDSPKPQCPVVCSGMRRASAWQGYREALGDTTDSSLEQLGHGQAQDHPVASLISHTATPCCIFRDSTRRGLWERALVPHARLHEPFPLLTAQRPFSAMSGTTPSPQQGCAGLSQRRAETRPPPSTWRCCSQPFPSFQDPSPSTEGKPRQFLSSREPGFPGMWAPISLKW